MARLVDAGGFKFGDEIRLYRAHGQDLKAQARPLAGEYAGTERRTQRQGDAFLGQCVDVFLRGGGGVGGDAVHEDGVGREHARLALRVVVDVHEVLVVEGLVHHLVQRQADLLQRALLGARLGQGDQRAVEVRKSAREQKAQRRASQQRRQQAFFAAIFRHVQPPGPFPRL